MTAIDGQIWRVSKGRSGIFVEYLLDFMRGWAFWSAVAVFRPEQRVRLANGKAVLAKEASEEELVSLVLSARK